MKGCAKVNLFDLPPTLTNRKLFARDRFMCAYCGGVYKHEDLTREHIHPRSRGGLDNWQSVVSACRGCNNLKADRFPHEAVQAHLSQHSKLTVSQRELVKKATLAQKRSVDDAMYEQLKSCNMPSFAAPMYLGDRIDGYIASDGLNAAIDHYNSSWSVLEDHLKRFKQQVECRREVVNQAMRQAHQRVLNTPDIRQMLEANELLTAGANDAFLDAGGLFVDSVVSETERQQKVMNNYLKELQDGMRIMSDRIDRARASMELSAQERKRAETAREMARQRERRLQREAQEWSQASRSSTSSFIGGSGVTVLPGQR